MVLNLNSNLFEKIIHKILLMSKKEMYMAKLHKLLYFLEFNYLERNNKELLGEVFIKNHFGPTSKNLKKFLNILINKGLITENEDEKGRTYYISVSNKNYKFDEKTNNELDFLEKNYLDLSTKKIADLSSEDNPYLITENLQEINKHSVFYRTDNFSVLKS
jgi:uncharacterized phage-associated protein